MWQRSKTLIGIIEINKPQKDMIPKTSSTSDSDYISNQFVMIYFMMSIIASIAFMYYELIFLIISGMHYRVKILIFILLVIAILKPDSMMKMVSVIIQSPPVMAMIIVSLPERIETLLLRIITIIMYPMLYTLSETEAENTYITRIARNMSIIASMFLLCIGNIRKYYI